MRARISVAEFSQDPATFLNRVRQGDSFVIEQDGEALAALEPIANTSLATWASLMKDLHDSSRPDSVFVTDLEEIQRNQPEVPTDVWSS